MGIALIISLIPKCDRLQAAGLGKLTRFSLQRGTVIPFAVAGLEKADRQSYGKLSRLVLHTADGLLYFFPINYGFSSTQDAADQINEFVRETTSQSLELEQDNRWFVYPVAIILIGAGSFSLWFPLARRSCH